MRQFSLFLCLFLLCGITGARAEVSLPKANATVDSDGNFTAAGTYYVIHSYNRGGVITQNADASAICHTTFGGYESLWTLVPINSSSTDVTAGVKIRNANGYFITSSRSLTTEEANAGTFYIYSFTERTASTTTPAEGIVISTTGEQTNGTSETLNDCLDASNTNTNIGSWNNSSGDGLGTTWVFEEVSSIESYANYLGINGPDASKVYTISSESRGALLCVSGETNISSTMQKNVSVDATSAYQQFAFVKSSNNNLYLVNVGSGQFISYDSSTDRFVQTENPQSSSVSLLESLENTTYNRNYFKFPFIIADNDNQMNLSNWSAGSNGPVLRWNDRTDGGNRLAIVAVDIASDAAYNYETAKAAADKYDEIGSAWKTLQTTIATANSKYLPYIGTDLYSYSETTSGSLKTAIDNAAALTYAEATADKIQSLQTVLDNSIAALVFNAPATGKFYRIKSVGRSTDESPVYLIAGTHAATNKGTVATFGSDETKSIFYFDESKQILAYSTGYYLYSNGNRQSFGGVSVTPTKFELKKPSDGSNGCCEIVYDSRVLYVNTETVDDVTSYYADNLNYGHNWTDKNSNFTFEEVESLPVTISSICEGYGTFFTPVDVTIPSDVEAFTGELKTVGSDTYLSLSQIEGSTIPAGTPVILKATAGSTYDFAIAGTATTIDATNDLKGQAATIEVVDNAYTLQYIATDDDADATGTSFYKYTGSELKGFKAYLQTALSVRGLIFNGNTTGIGAVETTEASADEAIYDLSGRRVASPKNGIYIIDGKKVIVK